MERQHYVRRWRTSGTWSRATFVSRYLMFRPAVHRRAGAGVVRLTPSQAFIVRKPRSIDDGNAASPHHRKAPTTPYVPGSDPIPSGHGPCGLPSVVTYAMQLRLCNSTLLSRQRYTLRNGQYTMRPSLQWRRYVPSLDRSQVNRLIQNGYRKEEAVHRMTVTISQL
jgi:hypothetical protein